MELATKLVRKIKKIFTTADKQDLISNIKQAIRTEINNQQLKMKTANSFYIPDTYNIFLAKKEDKEYIISNGYDKFIFDFINDKIKFGNKEVKDKLKVDFFYKKNIDKIIVESSFSNKPINLNNKRSTDTIIYKGEAKGETVKNNNFKIEQTLQFNNFSVTSELEILSDKLNLDKVEITAIETNIGRQRSNEVVLFDSSVSRVHAQIVKKKYYYVIKDLNSTNGVIVNGEYVKEQRLNNGDLILLGNIKLKFNLIS